MTGAGAGPEAAQDFSILGEHIIVIYIIFKKNYTTSNSMHVNW